MKHFFIIIFLSLQTIFAQNIRVTFIVNALEIPDSENIYIAGNQPELGNWNPRAVKLTRTSNITWEKLFEFPKGTILEYKFTRGDWSKEALNSQGMIPQNSVLKVSKDTLIKVWIHKWRDQGVVNKNFEGQITGDVRYHKNIKGKGILPRDVVVWLPPDYEKDTSKRYPVL